MKSKQTKQNEAVKRNVASVLKHGKFIKSGKKPSELTTEQILQKLGVPDANTTLLSDGSLQKILAMKNNNK